MVVLVVTACNFKVKHKPLKKEPNVLYLQETREDEKAVKFHVKKKSLYSSFFDNKGARGDRFDLAEEIEFDEAGNLLVHIQYTGGEKIHTAYGYDYDMDGNLVKMLSRDGNGNTLYNRESEYNSDNLEVKRSETQFKKTADLVTIFKYNDKTQLIRSVTETVAGEPKGREEFKYSGNMPVKQEVFNSQQSLQKVIKFEYDEKGRIVRAISDIVDIKTDTTFYEWDDADNFTKIDEGYFVREFQYNNNGDCTVESAFTGDGYLQYELKFFYNHLGLMDHRIKYDGERNPVLYTEYRYEFYEQ